MYRDKDRKREGAILYIAYIFFINKGIYCSRYICVCKECISFLLYNRILVGLCVCVAHSMLQVSCVCVCLD